MKCCMPPVARRINAVWCPPIHPDEPEHIAIGGEDTNVHFYDVTRVPGCPVVVNQLQAHGAPVVSVCWSFDDSGLASADCDGTVIIWKKDDFTSRTSRRSASIEQHPNDAKNYPESPHLF